MQKSILRHVASWVGRNQRLPAIAREQLELDRKGLPSDPGNEAVVHAVFDWLCLAQDRSKSQDGGVARDYSLLNQWASSYPETTGYIIPTFLSFVGEDERDFRGRARRMLDWLVGIQLPSGAFQGGKIDSTPVAPVTFNTGQIVLGLACGEATFGNYTASLLRAADWLVATQDDDGCWRRYPTPFASPGEKAYETHVAWGLLEAARLSPNRGYAEAALKNLYWALGKQRANGWFEDCCLVDRQRPLTHTLGYTLRGIIEGYLFFRDARLLEAARVTADGLIALLGEDGYLPGRLREDWSAGVTWVCLTGSAQIAHCWLLLYLETDDEKYLRAARLANQYVRRTVRIDGPDGIRGGVKGSFPINGAYGRFEYLNWAAKFLIDSLSMEERIAADTHRRSERSSAQ